jgi:homoserine dehydrogenase
MDPLGDVLLYGEGAGPMAAASGVISDLINLAAKTNNDVSMVIGNPLVGPGLNVLNIGQVKTEFYLRFMVTDKPGVLSSITGILGNHGISIASVTQKTHDKTSVVPVIMLTHAAEEQKLRAALDEIHKLPVVKSKPVAIRMEEL